MNTNLTRQLNHFLHVLASFYMDSFQGDILLDHQTIVECLDTNGEVECYVHKEHFDTEKRFEFNNKTRDEARQYAREHKWGQYNIMLRVEDDKLVVSVQKTDDKVPIFPMNKLEDNPLVPILRDCCFYNEYGKEETR